MALRGPNSIQISREILRAFPTLSQISRDLRRQEIAIFDAFVTAEWYLAIANGRIDMLHPNAFCNAPRGMFGNTYGKFIAPKAPEIMPPRSGCGVLNSVTGGCDPGSPQHGTPRGVVAIVRDSPQPPSKSF